MTTFDLQDLRIECTDYGTYVASVDGLPGEGRGTTMVDALSQLALCHANGVQTLSHGLAHLQAQLRRLGGAP